MACLPHDQGQVPGQASNDVIHDGLFVWPTIGADGALPPKSMNRIRLDSAQQLIDAGFRACFRIHLLDDDRTVKAVLSIGGRQAA